MPGGWVKGPRIPCRWCSADVPPRRRTFCSDACVHQWKLRTDPGYLREQVFARDRGVCAACGIDTEWLRKKKRKLDYTARREFEKEWGRRKTLWDADHIIAVAEGGGECDLSNMRTLCLKCHRLATAELRRRLSGRETVKAAPIEEQVFERDHGVCAVCGVDTEALRKSKRTLDYRARRAFEKEWGRGKVFWEAAPVEGGFQTVCLKCRASN
jgi:5-methylcytosine-specific restriction enzyme A